MNRFLPSSSLAALAVLAPFVVLAACGGSPKSSTVPSPIPATDVSPSASSGTPSPDTLPSTAPSATPPTTPPKPVTAADAAAACTTTATYDKKAPSKLTFNVKNTSDREVKMCWLEFYVYDKAGTQLAHVTLPYNYAIAPGASDGQAYEWNDLGKQIGTKAVASIETVITAAKFTDGGEFRDESLAPAKRSRAAKK